MSKSKAKIHSYMKHNKISDLFEELMGKLIQDLPANPIVYLIKFLENKNSGDTTEVYKGSVLLKHQLSKTQPFSNQAHITLNKNRKYDKPWLNNTRQQKSKEDLSKTAEEVLSHKNSFENEFQKNEKAEVSNEEKVIESVPIEKNFSGPKIFGKKNFNSQYDENELKCRDDIQSQSKVTSSVKKLSAKMSKKHKQQLQKKKILELEKSIVIDHKDSGISSNEDDVVEICEDFDELKNEGVLNPPKGGIHIKRRSETRTEQIKLDLNISKFFDKLGGALESDRPNSNLNFNNKSYDYLDDIESASQVTGPRRLVWEPVSSDDVSEKHLNSDRKIERRKLRSSQMFDDHTSSKSVKEKTEVLTTLSSEKKMQTKSSDIEDDKSTSLSKLTPARASAKMAMKRCKSKNTTFFPKIKEEKKAKSLVSQKSSPSHSIHRPTDNNSVSPRSVGDN